MQGNTNYSYYLLIADKEKTSDSTELSAVLQTHVEKKIDENHVEIVEVAETGCLTDKTLFTNLVRIPIEKGMRQGNPLSLSALYCLPRDGVPQTELGN